MRLRRFLTVLIGVVTLAGLPLSVATAEPGPPCADIGEGGGSYSTAPGTTQEFVSAQAETAAVACDRVAYTLNVYSTSGTLLTTDAASIADVDTDGDGDADISSLNFFVEVPDGPAAVCVTITSSVGRHVFDSAPDSLQSGCLLLDGGVPAGGWH